MEELGVGSNWFRSSGEEEQQLRVSTLESHWPPSLPPTPDSSQIFCLGGRRD